METLLELYQDRLKQLSSTFLRLLSQFETSLLFLDRETLKYRFDYVSHLIENTLLNDQERIIQRLMKELHQERTKTPCIKNISLNTTNLSSSQIALSEHSVDGPYQSEPVKQAVERTKKNVSCVPTASPKAPDIGLPKYNFKYFRVSPN